MRWASPVHKIYFLPVSNATAYCAKRTSVNAALLLFEETSQEASKMKLASVQCKKRGWGPVRPVKSRQRSIKVAQNDLTRKMIDFDTFTKIAKECGRFDCCQRL